MIGTDVVEKVQYKELLDAAYLITHLETSYADPR